MDENVIGMAGVRIGSSKYRRDEMTDGLWLVRIGNIDGPETGILPRAVNDMTLYHSFNIVNAEAAARAIGRAEPVQRKPESRNLNRVLLVADVKNVHVTKGTMFRAD